MSDVLFIVPMRANSQGLPRKHLHLLDGLPACVHVLRTCKPFGRVVVTSDDAEIRDLAEREGVTVLDRPPELAHPEVPLDAAVHWAVNHSGGPEAVVVTVQATSPLLSGRTIDKCIRLVKSGLCDTAMTVRDDRHVAWGGPLERPQLATEWANRQYLPPRWVMTGGCIATKRTFITAQQRFGGRIRLVEVTGAEAVDLDAPADWALAEWYSGAPTARETLMAKVLGEPPQWRGLVVQLSAWGESPEEWSYRTGETLTTGRVIKVRGPHTAVEADLAVTALEAERDLTIVTSAYHQPRAFLTFLRVLERRGLDRVVRLWNAPAPSRMDKLADEWRKIREYGNDVASYEDGLRYLDWRDQPLAVAA